MSPIQILMDTISRKRLLIDAPAGLLTCVVGNIISSYYLGLNLDSAGVTDSNEQLTPEVVLDVWCLACCLVGTYLVATWGRKPTALFAQFLLTTCLSIIDGLSKVYTGNTDGASSRLVYETVAVIFSFQGFCSVSWLQMLYLYPPEVMN